MIYNWQASSQLPLAGRTFAGWLRYLSLALSAAFSVAAEEGALHLKRFLLFARAMSERTKVIHVQSRALRRL